MPHRTYIHQRLQALSEAEQIRILHRALELQKAEPQRQPFECIAKAMGLPLFPKVTAATLAGAYRLLLTFDDGAEGSINFREFLDPGRSLEQALLNDADLFAAFKIKEGTLVWPSHGKTLRNAEGTAQFYPFNIDPALLYEAANPVEQPA